MEQMIEQEKIVEIDEPKWHKSKKRNFTILGASVWRILTYFIIYSILGFIIETAFGLLTKGVLESRKSFLYGPFCAIYGVGAVVMILFLQFFKRNNYTLFFGGFVIGSIVEYLVSLFGEMMLHVKWWDYSSVPLNIDGRICVFFSLFWGVLAIYLITHVNPKVDQLIEKIQNKFNGKFLKTMIVISILFMFLDCCYTGFALRMFYCRLTKEHNINIQGIERYILDYETISKDPKMKRFVEKYINDEVMLKTFPNLKVTSKEGKLIYISDVLKDIQPYYFKVFTPRVPGAVIEGN